MKQYLLYFLTIGLFSACSWGQSFNDSSLTGTWKGTSICQVKPSPCNDEIAVYHISKGEKPNSFHIIANKIIDGKEEDMAVDDFSYNPADGSLFCYIDKYKVTVKLRVKGRTIEGELTRDDKVSRIIKLGKISDR